jgi:hypothetical protein
LVQVQEINELNLGGLSLRSLNYIVGEYVKLQLHCTVQANNRQEYFQELTNSGQFEEGDLGDRITMLAIYMPIIREAAIAYKDLWNCYKIRKQPNRPNAVTGQPMVLYYYPDPEIRSYVKL